LWHSLMLSTKTTAKNRAEYLRKHKVFHYIGIGCSIMDRRVPLYARLISIGDNVHIATNVSFVTHDITHIMLSKRSINNNQYQERLGCIEIGNNVFIGTKCVILYDVRIGSNCIIGAGSIVTKDIPDDSVAVGIPAKRICSIDEYIKRREIIDKFPQQYRPRKQQVSRELEQWCWEKFNDQREKDAT